MELHGVVGVPPKITAADLTAHFRPHHQLDKLEPARKDPERQRGRRRRVPLSCLGLSETKHLGLTSKTEGKSERKVTSRDAHVIS